MYKKLTIACAIAALSCASLASAGPKAGYYRWFDDAGQVHFTQQPPTNHPYEFVETQKGFGNDNARPRSPEDGIPKKANSAPETAEQPKQQQYEILPDKNAERCEQAKKALESMSRGQRVRVIDENGNARVLNAEEQNEQKQQAQKLIDVYC